jgi:N-acetylmuramoyl-L-alanine amidase
MRIVNHELVCEDGDPIKLTRVKPGVKSEIVPEVIVAHYAVTHSLEATVAAQQARGYWAHLSIDGWNDGGRSEMRVVQQLPFNRRGSHAGESLWQGRAGVNNFSVGIEIANPGPLVMTPEGLKTTYGKLWDPNDAIETGPIKGYPVKWTHWAKYSAEETALFTAICLALKERYPIKALVGHSDISPGRKFDPGPAFDWGYVRDAVCL